MKICTLASSSSGNCTLVSQGDTHLLIDAGISMRRIVAGLKNAGLTPSDLTGILVTHEHGDHIAGVKMLVKHHHVPIFAPGVVAEGVCYVAPDAQRTLTPFQTGSELVLGELSVRSFPTMHDTPESVGYRIEFSGGTFVFVTDVGSVTDEVLTAACGADLAVIEANHDVEMLRNGHYPAFLKKRVLSERGHLSNDDSGRLAVALAESGTRTIVLAHLSRDNNTPRMACRTVARALCSIGAGDDVILAAAPPDDPSPVYIL